MPQIRFLLKNTVGHDAHLDDHFHSDPDRLRNEVIALTVTGQLSDMFEEMALPFLKLKLRAWWRSRRSHRRINSFQAMRNKTPTAAAAAAAAAARLPDSSNPLVLSVRGQAARETYNVQDDISEMVIQFGYLALFAPVWPLVSVGFLINNWVELRSDFLKLCTQHQRPHPIRTDGIGPWVSALDALTWLGSISTAALVHLFGSDGGRVVGNAGWMRLLVTVFLSEHLYLLLRVGVSALLRRIGSEQVRREKAETFAFRRKHLEGLEVQSKVREALYGADPERAAQQAGKDEDAFWHREGQGMDSEAVGLDLIGGLKSVKESDEAKRD